MKRTLLPWLIGAGVLAVFGCGLAWSRPDLLAALARWEKRQTAAVEPAAEPVDSSLATEVELADDGWCLAHRTPEATCQQCAGETGPNVTCRERLPVLRLKSPEIARQIQLETSDVTTCVHADTLSGNAEIVYNANAYAEVRPRVAGIVRDIETDEGHFHKKGDLLAVVDSSDVGTAKAQYLVVLPLVQLAEATLKRTQELTRANALPLKDELEASATLNRWKADLLNAAQRLRNLGFKDEDLVEIERKKDTSSLLRIVSPIEGTVVSRHAVSGEAIDPLHQLFVVADIRVMWAWIDVYESDIDRVKPDQKVTFRIGGLEDRAFEGRVDWIDTAVNPATRTIRVRSEIGNPDGRLRSNQFGRADIVVGQPHQATLVPKEAVQSTGQFDVVFIVQPDGSYRTQRVLIGEAKDVAPGALEATWGVQPGEKVVTTGSFILKAVLLKKLESMDNNA
jgi:cobalt-zinc-cadmium efflux system membrane fusion protein